MLMRPIGRGRLVFSKFVVAVFCAWVAVVIVVVTGLVIGAIFFGTDAIGPPLSFFVGAQSSGAIVGHLAVATAYVAWSMTGVVAFSFMVSCMTDVPFGAILAGIGFYFTSQILDQITSLGSIRYGLPDALLRRLGRPGHAGPVARRPLARASCSNSPTCSSSR